jgi:hypothetical protein
LIAEKENEGAVEKVLGNTGFTKKPAIPHGLSTVYE